MNEVADTIIKKIFFITAICEVCPPQGLFRWHGRARKCPVFSSVY